MIQKIKTWFKHDYREQILNKIGLIPSGICIIIFITYIEKYNLSDVLMGMVISGFLNKIFKENE
jgi:hypothetical protein